MQDVVQGLVRADILHHGRDSADGLERNAREGVERGTERLFRKAEYHDRGSSFPIGNHFATVRDQGLGPVDFQHVQPAAVQDFADDGQLLRVLHVSGTAAELRQNPFRNIVLRGAETACRDNDIIDS